jgi:hypothetical protein
MRKFVLFLTCGFLIMTSVALVEGQQGGKKGGFGGGLQQSPLTLLNRAEVKKELELTDEQSEKLPAEVMVAIGKVLNEKQMKRFKQIELQTRGTNAFKDKAVQTELKMNEEQTKSIASLIEDSNKEIAEMFKGGGGGFNKDAIEKVANARKEAKEKILTVLTKDQRKTWRDMIGEEFKLQQGNFGGKKKTDPKKDTQEIN